MNRAEGTVFELKYNDAGIFELNNSLVVRVSQEGIDGLNIAEEPVKEVDEVAELSIEGTAVELFSPFPVGGHIIILVAVPVAVKLDAEDFAESILVEEAFEGLDGRIKPILFNDEEASVNVLGGFDHLLAIAHGKGHRFFDEGVFTGFKDLYSVLSVQAVRGTDRDDLYILLVTEHRGEVGIAIAVIFVGEGFGPKGFKIADGRKLSVVRDMFGVSFGDSAAADDTKFNFRQNELQS
jgi:hypothetical protein